MTTAAASVGAPAAISSGLTAAEQEALKASTFQRLYPHVYLERFLGEGVRPDGRAVDGFRDITVNVGSITTADGSALVRLGTTTIVCGVKAEIAEPELDRPNEGFLVPNLDLPAICSPKFKPGPPTDEAQVLSDRLYEALLAASVVDTTSLCIHPGKAVWVLYVDATCINYDGNAFDAALVAMVAALQNTQLPQATYNEETGRTTCSRKTKSSLALGNLPVSFSFGTFDSHVLSDPTSFEEPLLTTSLSLVLSSSAKLISATQTGLTPIEPATSPDLLSTCLTAAQARCNLVTRQIYST